VSCASVVEAQRLRTRLLADRTALRKALPVLSPVTEETDESPEPMDEASVSLAQHEAISMAAHEQARLGEVEHALARIDAGLELSAQLGEVPFASPEPRVRIAQ
jgi:RNA polymerase-binding transcription factor DksA